MTYYKCTNKNWVSNTRWGVILLLHVSVTVIVVVYKANTLLRSL